MAQIEKLIPLILKWEGNYSDDPLDKGGATNKGITIATWRMNGYDKDGDGDIDKDDVKLISTDDFKMILKKNYWDKWRADEIKSQSVAHLLVDWYWGSGYYGIKNPQRLLGVTADGVVGPKTIEALNRQDAYLFWLHLKEERKIFIDKIVQYDASQIRFKQGWLNRLNDFKFID